MDLTSNAAPSPFSLLSCSLPKKWYRNGLVFFGDLFVEGDFDTLHEDHNIPKKHFFRHLQVHSFAQKHFPFPSLPPKNATDTTVDKGQCQNKIQNNTENYPPFIE